MNAYFATKRSGRRKKVRSIRGVIKDLWDGSIRIQVGRKLHHSFGRFLMKICASREVRYHEPCHTEFYTAHNKWISAQAKKEVPKDPSISAHEHTFNEIKEYIECHH